MKPLAGIRVLDFTQILSGPTCTMILADLGAEVIKLERAPGGDPARYTPPGEKNASTYFIGVNRSKKSVMMDLKDDRQKEIFFKMIEKADIVAENYKPGTMEKMGCGYDDLKKINPALVYIAISGYGQTGPFREKGALDLVIQAMSGLMSITGEKNGQPLKAGTSIADIVSGVYGAVGVLAALRKRDLTGEGSYVDVAMLDSAFSVIESAVASYCFNNVVPKPIGNRHPAAAPFQPFDTADGKMFVCCVSDEHWQRLCDGLNLEHLKTDQRFTTANLRVKNVDELETLLAPVFKLWVSDDLASMLEKNSIVYGEINTIDKIVNHQQIKERNMVVEVEYPDVGSFKVAGSPLKISGLPEESRFRTSSLGQDTLTVLSEYANLDELDLIYKPVFEKVEQVLKNKMFS